MSWISWFVYLFACALAYIGFMSAFKAMPFGDGILAGLALLVVAIAFFGYFVASEVQRIREVLEEYTEIERIRSSLEKALQKKPNPTQEEYETSGD